MFIIQSYDKQDTEEFCTFIAYRRDSMSSLTRPWFTNSNILSWIKRQDLEPWTSGFKLELFME